MNDGIAVHQKPPAANAKPQAELESRPQAASLVEAKAPLAEKAQLVTDKEDPGSRIPEPGVSSLRAPEYNLPVPPAKATVASEIVFRSQQPEQGSVEPEAELSDWAAKAGASATGGAPSKAEGDEAPSPVLGTDNSTAPAAPGVSKEISEVSAFQVKGQPGTEKNDVAADPILTSSGNYKHPATGPEASIDVVPGETAGDQVEEVNQKSEAELSEENHRRRQERLLLMPYEDFGPRSFTVEKELGEGAFGQVFKVVHKKSGAILALKIVPMIAVNVIRAADLAEDMRRELTKLREMQHPNIVLGVAATFCRWKEMHSLTEVKPGSWVEVGPQSLMVFSELCHGTIEDLIKDSARGILNSAGGSKVLYKIFLQCTQALAHVHALDVVHNDIKPDNILLTAEGDVKIGDFGLAANHDDQLERHQGGCMPYVPPSQELQEFQQLTLENSDTRRTVGSRRDVWALGLTFMVCMSERGGPLAPFYWRLTENISYADLDEEDRETLKRALVKSECVDSGAWYLLDSMLNPNWRDRCSMEDAASKILTGGPADPFFNRTMTSKEAETPTQSEDAARTPQIKFVEDTPLYLSAFQYFAGSIPMLALLGIVIWRFAEENQESNDPHSHYSGTCCSASNFSSISSNSTSSSGESTDDEDKISLGLIAGATMAAFAFASVLAVLLSAVCVRLQQSYQRYILLIFCIIGTFGFGMAVNDADSNGTVGALFILYALSQVANIFWTCRYRDADMAAHDYELSDKVTETIRFSIGKHFSSAGIAGLVGLTQVFQLAVLFSGMTLLVKLPINFWSFVFFTWFVNLPRYFVHWVIVRELTDSVNLEYKNSLAVTLKEMAMYSNSIIIGSVLAIQQPFWNVLEMFSLSFIGYGMACMSFGCCVRDDTITVVKDTTTGEKWVEENNNLISNICTAVGACTVSISTIVWKISQSLSVRCSKFYITIMAMDSRIPRKLTRESYFSFFESVIRLRQYAKELSNDEYTLTVFQCLSVANKGAAFANQANLCICSGLISALIAAAITQEAILYGYVTGYVAASTVFELQNSIFLWVWASLLSGDPELFPELATAMRQILSDVNKQAETIEKGRQGGASAPPASGDAPAVEPPMQENTMAQVAGVNTNP